MIEKYILEGSGEHERIKEVMYWGYDPLWRLNFFRNLKRVESEFLGQ